jgi:hypothetical protein
MRIYISGPITGTNDFKERFAEAAQRVKAAGHEYINPAYMDDVFPGASHSQYMAIDERLLLYSDAILMLPGWETSEGCKEERTWARILRLKEFTLDDFPGAPA